MFLYRSRSVKNKGRTISCGWQRHAPPTRGTAVVAAIGGGDARLEAAIAAVPREAIASSRV
jgi:hypothetical protein